MTEPSNELPEHGITPEADLPVALDDRPLLPERPHNWTVVGVISASVLIAVIVLFKYAVDVLFVLLVLGSLGFLLHRLMKVLAETELLRPAWVIIILLIVATVGWYAWPLVSNISPLDAFERSLHFETVLPEPAGRFLEWSERHGWAQRLLVPHARGDGGDTPLGDGTGVSIVVTSQQRKTRVGQPVTFTATLRFPAPPADGTSSTVEFWDGRTGLGKVAYQLSGNTAVASVTTTTLSVGTHSITARYARALLFGGVTSPPFTVTVTP